MVLAVIGTVAWGLVALFMRQDHWPFWKALLISLVIVIVFRGLVDLLFWRLIPWPSLIGLESQQAREEDVLGRRRAWFWDFWFNLFVVFALIVTVVWLFQGNSWIDAMHSIFSGLGNVLSSTALWVSEKFTVTESFAGTRTS